MGEHESVSATVDVVCFTIREGRLSVLLVQRANDPFAGAWALPGGFVDEGEDLPAAAVRELAEETGIDDVGHIEQLGTYGKPGRDPRGRVISVAYVAFAPEPGEPTSGSDAAMARFWPVDDLDLPGRPAPDPDEAPALAFDHAQILADGLARAASKIEYTSLAAAFVAEPFSLADLRRVYEAVWGVELDRPNFRRKVLSTHGFVIPVEASRPTKGPAAALYRRGSATLLHPALLSPASRRAAHLDDDER